MARIKKLLIANRAEIARRIIRTCRSAGIDTVAVYSEADRELPHVTEADEAICLGPAAAESSYLDPQLLLDAARRSGADAVHPGYGFVAESSAFAEAVAAAGLTWVGPPPAAIRTMGDKSAARRIASDNGIPTIPGYDGEDCSDSALIAAASELGFPLLVKAAGGGGGRGMRRVTTAAQLPDALTSARREAEAAFGNDRLLLERYLERPRHIEVQVFGDVHGTVVHLGERECSIQRRHQKIVEEAPSPVVDDELRQRLGEAAVAIATLVDYVGAGTVEFLVDPEGKHYFLEMNTRLQVEHPVTEMVTDLDLVALQLAVAEGEPLPFEQDEVVLDGHAIEVRLYAEDPTRDYLASSGALVRFELPASEGDGVRVDAGYRAGNVIGVHYDSMLAKLVVWGETRELARRRLARALQRCWIPGLATNLPLLREIAVHPAFEAGELDTSFLSRHGLPTAPPLNLERGAIAATAAGWLLRRERSPYPAQVRPGWRVEGPARQSDRWQSLDRQLEVAWRTLQDDVLGITVLAEGEEPQEHRVLVLGHAGDELRLEIDGQQRPYRVARRAGAGPYNDGDVVYVHLGDGESVLELVPRFPAPLAADVSEGDCIAPTPGNVVKIDVGVGDSVQRGQHLVTLEAMKMEHHAAAPTDGVVAAIPVQVGDQVDQGTVLVRLETAGGEQEAAEQTS